MGMIEVTSKGDFTKTKNFFNKMIRGEQYSSLERYGQLGANLLSHATPVDSGLASQSWGYRIIRTPRTSTIEWFNTDVESGANVIFLIQYGHGTGTGGYVAGRDFINPAMRPAFDRAADDVWEKVKNG